MEKALYIEEMDKFIDTITEKGMSVVGCSEEQIINLENDYGILPQFYKIFLKRMGISAGSFIKGSLFFYNSIHDVNEGTRALMKENNISPPPKMFAFLMHQGYTSLFFINSTDSAPDPAVFCYTEGEEISDINMTFGQLIKAEINNYCKRRFSQNTSEQ